MSANGLVGRQRLGLLLAAATRAASGGMLATALVGAVVVGVGLVEPERATTDDERTAVDERPPGSHGGIGGRARPTSGRR